MRLQQQYDVFWAISYGTNNKRTDLFVHIYKTLPEQTIQQEGAPARYKID